MCKEGPVAVDTGIGTVDSIPKWVCTHTIHGLWSNEKVVFHLYKFFSLALIFIFISQNTQLSPRKLHDVTKEKATRPQMKDQEPVQSVQSKDSGSMVIENIEITFSLDQRIF